MVVCALANRRSRVRTGQALIMSRLGNRAASVGATEHGNTVVLVTVAGGGEFLDRRRIELGDPGLPALPHHHEGSWAVGRYLNSPWARPRASKNSLRRCPSPSGTWRFGCVPRFRPRPKNALPTIARRRSPTRSCIVKRSQTRPKHLAGRFINTRSATRACRRTASLYWSDCRENDRRSRRARDHATHDMHRSGPR